MLNKWIGMGRLARDPDLRHTQSGMPVVSFTIAVDRDFKAISARLPRLSLTRSTLAGRRKRLEAAEAHRRDMAAVSRSSMMSREANLRSSMILMGNYRSKEARNGKE